MDDKMIVDAARQFVNTFQWNVQPLCYRIIESINEKGWRLASTHLHTGESEAFSWLTNFGYIESRNFGKEVGFSGHFWNCVEESMFVCQSDVFSMPKRSTEGAACFDIQSATEAVIPAGGTAILDTGLRFRIPVDHALMVYSRSGHGFKHDVSLSNGTGVIDSDYRGELKVKLRNDGTEPFTVKHGDRVAQAMLIKLPSLNMIAGTVENDTERGIGGFGSTGN